MYTYDFRTEKLNAVGGNIRTQAVIVRGCAKMHGVLYEPEKP